MAEKNYYVVLGVPRSEGDRGIRRAFRELALQHHPDHAGPESKESFQRIAEAFETLSHPERRASYDRVICHKVPISRTNRPRSAPEPMIPHPPARSTRDDRWVQQAEPLAAPSRSLSGVFGGVRPSWEAMADHLQRNVGEGRYPKSGRVERLNLQVVLGPEEARRGVVLTLQVPSFRKCRTCGGTGRVWAYRCSRCAGDGMAESRRPVEIAIPAGTRDGEVIVLPLGTVGVRNLRLFVHIRVERS